MLFTSNNAPSLAQTRNAELLLPWKRVDAANCSALSAGSGSAGFAFNKPKVLSISKRMQITGVMRAKYSL